MTDYLQPCRREWVRHNENTDSYDTPDGTKVAAELVDNVSCLADVLHISAIRERQRFETRCGGRTVDTLLDECGPEGAYIPEPEITEPWLLKAASSVALFVSGALLCLALFCVAMQFADRNGWLPAELLKGMT